MNKWTLRKRLEDYLKEKDPTCYAQYRTVKRGIQVVIKFPDNVEISFCDLNKTAEERAMDWAVRKYG